MKEKLIERLVRYAKIDTQSDFNGTICPTTPGQWTSSRSSKRTSRHRPRRYRDLIITDIYLQRFRLRQTETYLLLDFWHMLTQQPITQEKMLIHNGLTTIMVRTLH